ncbi:MAG TPA: LysR family transcriptional regulator, partial [Bordetella sp.]|nr:LysR family transcriptional regulator [Bordetella sp.]
MPCRSPGARNDIFQIGNNAMDLIECMEVFQEVGKSLSFSKAAESRASSRSSVTKKIAWLEGYFGVQLFNRNTKHVSLT